MEPTFAEHRARQVAEAVALVRRLRSLAAKRERMLCLPSFDLADYAYHAARTEMDTLEAAIQASVKEMLTLWYREQDFEANMRQYMRRYTILEHNYRSILSATSAILAHI